MAGSSARDCPTAPGPAVLTAVLATQLLWAGCDRAATATAPQSLDGAACPFAIYWPPRDPQETPVASSKPLLRGQVTLDATEAEHGATEVGLVVRVTRPSDEADRQFWNSELAFADIDWMEEVRVWDADGKWLWPNLPYLLRLPGQERVERYGGTDPGKNVDNDFAAVLIRKYDAAGETEASETDDAPLVSAEWYADGKAKTDLKTIVHVARSDRFVLHLGGNDRQERGHVKLWLIYADFLGARPPRPWPRQREWAGGILAYFEIDWETVPGQGCRGIIRHKRPEVATGFDWAGWVDEMAAVRLSDVGN